MAVNHSNVRRNLMAEFNAADGGNRNGHVNGEGDDQEPPPNVPDHVQILEQQAREASERWNFDFVNFQKLDGPWEWRRPDEEFSSSGENAQEEQENAQQEAQQQPDEPTNQEPPAS